MNNFGNNLYSEILKYESTMIDFNELTEKVVTSPEIRDSFLIAYVNEIIESMSSNEIKKSYSKILLNSLYSRCDLDQEDIIVKECLDKYPHLIKVFDS